MDSHRIKLSKFLAYILRHAPGEYNLDLDKNGYADLDNVLEILSKRFRDFKKEDLSGLVENDPKGRFEIIDKKIRATYGHSVNVQPKGENVEPPEILYHGTSKENADIIFRDGLKPMGRKFAHLSTNEEDAHTIGLRHTRQPVILKIMAKKASQNGVKFFKEGNLFLTEFVPEEYIEEIK